MIVEVEDSDDAVSIVDDFSAATDSTPNPHAGVQVQVPRVTSLHMDVESERVGLGVDFICLSRVIQLLQGLPRPDTPSFISNRDVCRRVVMGLKQVARVEVGGEVGCDELFVLSARHNRAFPPTTIPVTGDVANPVPLSPNTRSNTDLRVQLDTHLEIALENRFGDGKGARGRGVALEADHGVVITLLRFGGGSDGRSAVDGFVEDWVVRIMLFHSTKIIGTLEQVLTLTGGIFCANRLAVDALCGETLVRFFCAELDIGSMDITVTYSPHSH